jgi:hypothetical protein
MQQVAASSHRDIRRYALVLGTNEIASAVALEMSRAGWAVVLAHDPFPPVIRRKMAFHDVLFGDAVVVDNIEGTLAEDALELLDALKIGERVAVTPLQLHDLIALRTPDVLIDGRMQMRRATPDLRHIAPMTIGLGPNFMVGENCDLAIENRPSRSGRLIRRGSAAHADHISQRLGGVGEERFVYASREGLWHTAVDIGIRVFKDFVVGRLDGLPVHAPIDGVVRGVVRDGSRIPAGVKVLEIDPRGRNAQWTGIDNRSNVIAKTVLRAAHDSNLERAARSISSLFV